MIKVKISDKAALETVTRSALEAYANLRGWREPDNDSPYWWHPDYNGVFSVPAEGSRDYALRVYDAIETLAISEDKSQLEVFWELVEETPVWQETARRSFVGWGRSDEEELLTDAPDWQDDYLGVDLALIAPVRLKTIAADEMEDRGLTGKPQHLRVTVIVERTVRRD
jgi:hypothetical protein